MTRRPIATAAAALLAAGLGWTGAAAAHEPVSWIRVTVAPLHGAGWHRHGPGCGHPWYRHPHGWRHGHHWRHHGGLHHYYRHRYRHHAWRQRHDRYGHSGWRVSAWEHDGHGGWSVRLYGAD